MKVEVLKMQIPTYPEAKREELPMFAENRVHQRTSGNPYPNKIVLEAQRKIKENKEYTVIKLENEFIELAILPDLGGKIWYAYDKNKGYNFIYKNNVIKPALIGVLGSWTSGGMEFNWPFHHRASTFMPVDYAIERGKGYATVWISEHDPIDRMKGMVGISLKDGECIFETKVKVDNLTDIRKSFLWWENTAVPVNQQYEIFFPEDVNYVRFHYKRSVTTFPIANNDKFGAFNGIYYDGDTDISKHKNTKKATSYFSADSVYDYFGGYDNGIKGGIVHIADHHISPGKKMFTWAYSQLAKTWENALTDDDGQYAELMAGCYSDNQPDLSWLMPNETKEFSQKWYPIHDNGKPVFANDNFALFNNDKLRIQSVRKINDVKVLINGKEIGDYNFPCYDVVEIDHKLAKNDKIELYKGELLLSYTFGLSYEREIPQPRKEYPYFKEIKSAQELYKLGLHADQYRSPEYRAEDCYKEALLRDGYHTPSMIALAEIYYNRFMFDKALEYVNKAEKICCEYNTRLESGRLYYIKALILEAMDDYEKSYDYLYKAYFANDYKCQALLKLALLDIRNNDIKLADAHIKECLSLNGKSTRANALYGYILFLMGEKKLALKKLNENLELDRVNLYSIFFKAIIQGDFENVCQFIKTDISQNMLDFISILYLCNKKDDILSLIDGMERYVELNAMLKYVKASLLNKFDDEFTNEGIAFPSRIFEMKVLENICKNNPNNFYALYLLGCIYYGKTNYEMGKALFEKADKIKDDYRIKRNLAVCYYSHFNDKEKAKEYLKKAVDMADKNEKQMNFEYAYLSAKMNDNPKDIINFIKSRNYDRDELYVELARAYNHNNQPKDAINTLLSRNFVACEGGEHYIADQYMYAYYLLGKDKFIKGDYKGAIEEFSKALTLPQSLGSGLWNDIKQTPYLYFIAMCYDRLGDKGKAVEMLNKFIFYKLDYFTNMYYNTYRFYLAKALKYMGKVEQADKLIDEGIESDLKDISKISMGYFGTTPFFISYIDDNDFARQTYFAYRLFLYYSYKQDKKNIKKFKDIIDKDGYGIYIEDFTD